ncbi:MAG: transposase [Candidatus Delongbacteria bacterium]|nr:MAG: transposase [Candidatus Delongbacteria bacterium]
MLGSSNFSRTRKLTVSNLFSIVLSLVGNNANKGIASKCLDFLRLSKLQNLALGFDSIDKSSISKARKKLPWQEFQNSFYKAVEISNKLIPNSSKYKWNNLSVFGVDGSRYTLPASKELKKAFDPKSGLSIGKGHYPKCLVTTIYNLFTRVPIARSIAPNDSSERHEFIDLLDKIPDSDSLLIFDRGYPGYGIFKELLEKNKGYFLFRSSSSSTFREVEEFIKTGKREGIVTIFPNREYKNSYNIKLRVIIDHNPDGEKLVFLTNLLDFAKFSANEIVKLYFKRWEIEVNYRNEKTSFKIENFHSKNYNGIMQELYAISILNIIARVISSNITEEEKIFKKEHQFKNTVTTLAINISVFCSKKVRKAQKVFKEIVDHINKLKYYRENKKEKSQPRVIKKTISKWYSNRKYKLGIS